MARTMVTGAGGFVGANVARRLLADGHHVAVLLRPGGTRWRLDDVLGELEVYAADVADEQAVRSAFDAVRPERVFHLAAHGGYSWQHDVSRILAANVLGTANVLEAAAETGVEVVVSTGTSLEYGRKDHPPAEDEPLDPDGVYAIGKAAGTWLAAVAARQRGLRVATLRLYSVYGPWEEPGRLLPVLAGAALRRRLPPRLVSPETGRDFVWIDDVVDAYLLAAAADVEPGAVYNVGTGVQTRLRDLVGLARRLFGIEEEPEWGTLEARQWDTETWVADPRRAGRELGWRARTSLEDGLRALAAWLEELEPGVRERYREAEPA